MGLNLNDFLDVAPVAKKEVVEVSLENFFKLKEITPSLESLKEKMALRNEIVSKGTMNKGYAEEINGVFTNFIGSKLCIEEFSSHETKTNYDVSKVFMDTNILNEVDSTLESVKMAFNEGLDEVQNYYDKIRDELRPETEEGYQKIVSKMNEEQFVNKVNSPYILFNKDTKEFVDVFEIPLSELCNTSLGVDNDFDAMSFISYVNKLNSIFETNVSISTLFKVTRENNTIKTPMDFIDVLVDYKTITLNDIFFFYKNNKGLASMSTMISLIDFSINHIEASKNDLAMIPGDRGVLAKFMIDMKDESEYIVKSISFVQNVYKDISDINSTVLSLIELIK
jgi:hypothetical protein